MRSAAWLPARTVSVDMQTALCRGGLRVGRRQGPGRRALVVQRRYKPDVDNSGSDAAAATGAPPKAQQQPASQPDAIPGEDLPSLPGPPTPALAAAGAGAAGGAVLMPAAAAPQGPASVGTTPTGPINLEAEANRFRLLSLALYGAGAMLLSFPDQFFQTCFHQAPTATELLFCRFVGVTALFQGGLAHMLKGAAERDRLGSTTAQRVMLGLILPIISNLLTFRTMVGSWGAAWNPVAMSAYPAVLFGMFLTTMLAFQPYNPYFLLKLVWPLIMGMMLAQLIPTQLPVIDAHQLPANAPTWLKAGLLTIVPARGLALLARALNLSFKVFSRAAPKYIRKQVGARSLGAMIPDAGPALTKTVARKMDFSLPSNTVAWGYWLLMLSYFSTMFEAYVPELMFMGQVSSIAHILKMTWSAGFLAAAFACDALKTAADRGTLYLKGNIQLNLCLVLLEAGFGMCMLQAMAAGLVNPALGAFRLATSVAAVAFCSMEYLAASKQAQQQNFPSQPTALTSQEYQTELEKKDSYVAVSAMAITALTIITVLI